MKNIVLTLTALASASLVGCASAPKSLYSWGEYPQQTYLSLSMPEKALPQEQIATLEKNVEQAKAKNLAVPPGMYAHLGLLNLTNSNGPRALEYFELERQVYPESSILMERFLNKMGNKTAGSKSK